MKKWFALAVLSIFSLSITAQSMPTYAVLENPVQSINASVADDSTALSLLSETKSIDMAGALGKEDESVKEDTFGEEESDDGISLLSELDEEIIHLQSTNDFVALSMSNAEEYENKTLMITRSEGTGFNLVNTEFAGFGSAEHPFKGTVQITNGESSDINIPLDHSFFNYLDQSATIETGLFLEVGGDMTSPVLAEHFVNTSSSEEDAVISVRIKAVTGQNSDADAFPFAGIIGTMEQNTKLSLTVENKTEAGTALNLQSDGNLGLFCNTMKEGSSLTVSATDSIDFRLSANGHVGGVVGYMKSDAALTVASELTLTEIVNAGSTDSAAGGLVGKADTANNVSLKNVISIDVAIDATGAASAGGYIGDATYSGNANPDLSNYQIDGFDITGGNHAGGLFGNLKHSCAEATNTESLIFSNLHLSNVKHSGESWQFGGLAGMYTSSRLADALVLSDSKFMIFNEGTVSSMGGLIGFVGDVNSIDCIDGAAASYISISNVEVNVTSIGTVGNNGGMVGEAGTSGHFLDFSGNNKVSTTNTFAGNSSAGGLVGAANSGVIRLTGTTDLSGLLFNGARNQYGQILGARSSSTGVLVYALGDGNGDGTSVYGWQFVRPSMPAAVPDTGSYGEVIRLDGEDLTETQRTGKYVLPDNSVTEVLTFYTDSHKVIPHANITGNPSISSKRDAVVLAIVIQFGSPYAVGAFDKYNATGTTLLSKDIELNADIDLTGTGVVGFLRDNGTQTYSGTFKGNGHIITMAAGESYCGSDLGSGQLYNHSNIGLLGVLNGSVEKLTLDGTITFGMNAGGIVVNCGSVAGAFNTATLDNVVVNTKTNYDTGAMGDGIPVSRVGGFLGTSTEDDGAVSFTSCQMSGNITNNCTAWDYYLGGFIGYIGHGKTVNFIESEIRGAVLTSGKSEIAKVGGLIAGLEPFNKAHTVTIDDFVIDGLKVTNTANVSSGGLFGYDWRNTTLKAKNVNIKSSSLSTKGVFGGLVYEASGYWKLGDGTSANAIVFESGNKFAGKTAQATPSALLLAVARDTSYTPYTAYVEIMKDGLQIQDDAVSVTLDGGNYFDDLAGQTKWSDGSNAIVSIGLTAPDAAKAVLINQTERNTWKNKCGVNGSVNYTNKKTRYYYNLDYYRMAANDKSGLALGSGIDSGSDLLCWSVYMDAASNIKSYFASGVGGNITGEIDLSGISYYPVNAYMDIKDAVIHFDYDVINGKETDDSNKPLNNADLQHYQMQCGLFTQIITKITGTTNDRQSRFNVNNLTLSGVFGPYNGANGGVLICDTAKGGNATYKTILSLHDIKLDGIRCADIRTPLLINSVGDYTTLAVSSLTTTEKYNQMGKTLYAASSLIGAVGSKAGTDINVTFADIGLDARTETSSTSIYETYHTIFTEATFLASFGYNDNTSGGSYNFEKATTNITYGKEISNTDSGRNKYADGVTSQYCYFDTYGTGEYVVDSKGPGNATKSISKRFIEGYLPYVKESENGYYHELDINQKAYYIIEGCGTYGHPYQIKTILVEGEELVSPAQQMQTLMDLLDGQGNGTVICVNTAVLDNQLDSADLHTSENSTGDTLFMKKGNSWVEVTQNGKRFTEKSGGKTRTQENIIAYVRNAYYEIAESFELDLANYNGIGSNGKDGAFSGVIIGEKIDGQYPTITLKSTAKSYEVGGLIRYSQGSVVKNLNITMENVSLEWPAAYAQKPAFFGGVIGWVIGGDNIIDNVNVTGTVSDISGDRQWLAAIGGYVGYVGGNDCKMGGGVVFRNISCPGLTMVGTTDVSKETDGSNYSTDRYYWNPYVGRVLDGYACAEADSCGGMGDNTDKNYKIPKLDTTDRFKIVASGYVWNVKNSKTYAYPENTPAISTIMIDSPQDIWVLSSIINSGAGAKAGNAKYSGNTSGAECINAYCYGRVRTGSYDGIGTVNWSENDQRDETYKWGGIENLLASVSYLGSYIDESTENSVIIAEGAATCFMAVEIGFRMLDFKSGIYDLSGYGNGFRGIGASYFYDNANNALKGETITISYSLRNRVLRLSGNSITGNNSTISYQRNIYEYPVELSLASPLQVRQAGLFPIYNQYIYLDNIKNSAGAKPSYSKGVIKDLTISATITTNQTENRTGSANETVKTAFGTFAGRTVYGMGSGMELNNVKIVSDSKIENAYYAGGFFGRLTKPESASGTITFKSCNTNGLCINNAVIAGSYVGQGASTCPLTFQTCSVNGTIVSARNSNDTCYLGGLIGQVQHKFTVKECTAENLTLYTQSNSGTESAIGGIVGYITGNTLATFDKIIISELKCVSRGYAGGIAGYMNENIPYNVTNTEISGSYIATTTNDRYVGGLVGVLNNGSLNGFNVRSKNNVVGYLITKNSSGQTILDTTEASLNLNSGTITLTTDNVGLRESDSNGKYWLYSNYTNKALTNSYVGIWVGKSSSKPVKIVAASRTGDYSAVKNFGTGAATGSYVVYADYTGSAAAASNINVSPNTGIVLKNTNDIKLTSDGAYLAAVRTIIEDTAEENYMKGFFGEKPANRTGIVGSFSTDILTTYKTEESSAAYQGTDFPILVLAMNNSTEANNLIKQYISALTNLDQLAATSYVSITPTTYVYEDKAWKVAKTQSMMNQSNGSLKLNPGKYDNTHNQITILDVVYESPISNSKDVYHLYIPVLVKKIMGISFDVQITNGAACYASSYASTAATLASYGENFTAKLTFTYDWTVEEWNSAIAGGMNLLWSFDKQVSIDDLPTVSGIDLTLVDMNTRGYAQAAFLADELIIASGGLVKFDKFSNYQSVPICDLLPLTEKEATDGALKKVNGPEDATLRRWDLNSGSFVYYALKAEDDPEGTKYFNVWIDDTDFVASETYYLVLNCTGGSEMYNKTMSLGNGNLGGEIPYFVKSKTDKTYILGEFYALNIKTFSSQAESLGSSIMEPGSNDYVDVLVSTDVTVKADESFDAYVTNRPVFFRYAIHMTDENGQPVEIKASNIVQSLKIGSKEMQQVPDLDSVAEGYVYETLGNITYLTVKTRGSEYIGQTVSAAIRYQYDDAVTLQQQFPTRPEGENIGVKFKVISAMAYDYGMLGSTSMSAQKVDSVLYYCESSSYASLNYDSYNVESLDGNTSQLGLNGKESGGAAMQIRSRAIFDATTVSGLERTDSTSAKYPCYLEGTISLGKKTEIDKPNGGIGKTYEEVAIQNFLSDFAVSCGEATVDTSSSGLGVQSNGTYKFRILLTPEQVSNLLTEKVLININYNVKTDALEQIAKGQYANYKVTLRTVLKNNALEELTNEPTDYLIYTNAKVYLGIIGVTDTDGE